VDDRRRALETLERTGVVDDRRFAQSRASSLAERGAGDALIRHDLAQAGVDAEVIDHALDAIESEHDRARRIVARRGASAKTARYLVGKGFAEEVVRAAVAQDAEEPLG
jgi:SOS response regulatory protein OraA/RecX